MSDCGAEAAQRLKPQTSLSYLEISDQATLCVPITLLTTQFFTWCPRTQPHLVELWRVYSSRPMVQQQLVADLRLGGRSHGGDLQHILDGSTAIDIHEIGFCASFQHHVHEHVVTVPGCLVERSFKVVIPGVDLGLVVQQHAADEVMLPAELLLFIKRRAQ